MTAGCHQQGSMPLTFQQQARLERSRQALAAGSAPRSNLVTDAVSITGALDVSRLRQAARVVWRGQPALRSRFFPDHQDLSPCQETAFLPRLEAGMAPDSEFDPAGPERFALFLQERRPAEYELRLLADHLVFDARSLDVFWDNLWAAYLSPVTDQGCHCEPGYVGMLRAAPRRPDPGRTRDAIEILRGRQSPFGYLDLPVCLDLDSVGSRRVSVLSLPLDGDLRDRVAELARRRRTTVFAVVTAATFAAIRTVGNTETPMLYTFLENRRSARDRAAIGWFAATVLLVDHPASQGDQLDRAKQALLDALLHGARATEEVHRACGAGRKHASLPSVSLSAGQPARDPVSVGGIEVRGLAEDDDPTGSVPRGRIAIEYWPDMLQFNYETDRFDAATVRAFATVVRHQIERVGS